MNGNSIILNTFRKGEHGIWKIKEHMKENTISWIKLFNIFSEHVHKRRADGSCIEQAWC